MVCIPGFFMVILLSVPVLSYGSSEEGLPEGGSEEDALVICPEPHPQVCTRDYRPVCALLADGTFKTFSNGCTACTDPAVTGYRERACE